MRMTIAQVGDLVCACAGGSGRPESSSALIRLASISVLMASGNNASRSIAPTR
jgi:hypothetical protein